jgi:hypothetical protein
MSKNELTIKDFVKAKTPEELQKKMLLNSIKTKAYHDYRIIFANGFWYAWFEMNADELISFEMNNLTKAKNG